jgi:hypothetical protein
MFKVIKTGKRQSKFCLGGCVLLPVCWLTH